MGYARQVGAEDRIEKWYEWADPEFFGFFRRAEAFLYHMFEFGRYIGVDSVEEIFELFARIDVGDVGQHFHFFLELIFEKAIVDPDDSLDVNIGNNILHEVLGVEP